MKKLACVLALSLTLHHAAAAESVAEQPDAAAPPLDESTESQSNAAGAFDLKNKSSFTVESNSRNPFWPIGWKPALKQSSSGNEQSGPDISPTSFLISSIMTGNGSRFAIINGKPMQEGQVFGLQSGTQVYQITVKSIEDGQVILQRRDQELAVPLRRK